MADEENGVIAPEDKGEGTALSHYKGRQAFGNIRRALSDEELSSPAVQRLLIDEIERLEKENGKLGDYQDSYYDAKERASVLNEKLKTNVAQEVIFGVCLTVGAALVGLSPSLWDPDKPHGWVAIALGVILIMGGIASKVVKR